MSTDQTTGGIQKGSSVLALFLSTGALLCCALPVALATLAGGAALAALVGGAKCCGLGRYYFDGSIASFPIYAEIVVNGEYPTLFRFSHAYQTSIRK